jgi:transposase IS66 family protein
MVPAVLDAEHTFTLAAITVFHCASSRTRISTQSGPLMKQLHDWMEAQFAERKTEPNSGLGKAISYLLNHWPKLTLFLQQPGAPLDNNIVERALKKAILNRKNALFSEEAHVTRIGVKKGIPDAV